MHDIDKMDIFYYLEVLSYRISDEKNPSNYNSSEKEVYIDECGWL